MSELDNKKMDYGIHFQRSIIKLMMEDIVFCSKVLEYLSPYNFANELSWFYEVIKNRYNGMSITREHFEADIATHDAEKQIKFTKELNEIMASNADPLKIKTEMTAFIRSTLYVFGTKEAANAYNGKDRERAYELTMKGIEKIYKVNFLEDGFNRIRVGDAKTILAKMSAEDFNAIPTGIHAIDKEIKGMLPGTFTLFMGASNSGKSMLMPNLAYEAAIRGKRTFISIHEDEQLPTETRYLSCFSGIEYNKLAYHYASLTPDELRRLDIAEKLLDEFVVMKFMYTHDSTIEGVFAACKKLKKEWRGDAKHPADGFDLYLCDYGQCLTSNDFKKYDSVRHLNEYVYHMLKQLALELNIAAAGGAQTNREGMSKSRSGATWLRCTDVAESYGIIKKASNVITINRSDTDMANNRIVFLLDKARNGRCPVAVECVSDFACSRTHLPAGQTDVSSSVSDSGPSEDSLSSSKSAPDMGSKTQKVQQYHG